MYFIYFEMLNFSNWNVVCISACPTCHEVVLRGKLTFYVAVAYVKMTKFGTKINLFTTCVLSFCTAHKNVLFHEAMREHI
jgi:hypothetical protein